MNIFKKILLCSFSFLITLSSLSAQDSLKAESFNIGFGAAVYERFEFYFPINISDNLRIEPNFELRMSDRNQPQMYSDRFSLDFNIGIFPIIKYNRLNIYYGARIGIIYYEEKSDYDNSEDKGFIFSPAIGGEYFLLPRFSLSTELYYQFRYYHHKRNSVHINENSYIKTGTTISNVIIRVYLF